MYAVVAAVDMFHIILHALPPDWGQTQTPNAGQMTELFLSKVTEFDSIARQKWQLSTHLFAKRCRHNSKKSREILEGLRNPPNLESTVA